MNLQNLEAELVEIEQRIEKAKEHLKTLKNIRRIVTQMLEEAKKLG